MLLNQDEARFPLVPTLRTTLGVKGFRPVVGTWDYKDLVYAFGALKVISGRLTTRLLECPARLKARTGQSKCRHLQRAFARHLRDIARAYPASRCPRVVIIIDNAPWQRGAVITAVLEEFPHLEFYRLPSYSPALNPIERLWKVLQRPMGRNWQDGKIKIREDRLILLHEGISPEFKRGPQVPIVGAHQRFQKV